MQKYVRSGVAILNDITKDLKNLNNLGIYLSRQTDINALKTLNYSYEKIGGLQIFQKIHYFLISFNFDENLN